MSWSYSQALVLEYADRCCSDTELSVQLNTTPMPDQFYWPDKTTEHSRLSRFGMTCVPLTVSLGEELLTLFLVDSLVRTLALPVRVPESTAKDRDYGEKWRGLLGKYDPVTHSLKTAQHSLLEDSTACCPILPRWGSMLSGELFQQQTPARHIAENEFGSWATPTTMDKLPPKSEKALLREATIARPGRSKPANLRDQVSNMQNWPTPTAQMDKKARGNPLKNAEDTVKREFSLGLPEVVAWRAAGRMWPTPQASDNRDRGNISTPAISRRIEKGKQVMLSMMVSEKNGRLNPEFVEWLMGCPIGHTDLKPLATGRFQEFVQQHGRY